MALQSSTKQAGIRADAVKSIIATSLASLVTGAAISQYRQNKLDKKLTSGTDDTESVVETGKYAGEFDKSAASVFLANLLNAAKTTGRVIRKGAVKPTYAVAKAAYKHPLQAWAVGGGSVYGAAKLDQEYNNSNIAGTIDNYVENTESGKSIRSGLGRLAQIVNADAASGFKFLGDYAVRSGDENTNNNSNSATAKPFNWQKPLLLAGAAGATYLVGSELLNKIRERAEKNKKKKPKTAADDAVLANSPSALSAAWDAAKSIGGAVVKGQRDQYLDEATGKNAKTLSGVPWFIPATILAGGGSLYAGYKGYDKYLSERRKRKAAEKTEELKKMFMSALQRESRSKLGSALDEFIETVQTHCPAKEAGLFGTYLTLLGTLGTVGLMQGAAAGYKESKEQVRKKVLERLQALQETEYASDDIGINVDDDYMTLTPSTGTFSKRAGVSQKLFQNLLQLLSTRTSATVGGVAAAGGTGYYTTKNLVIPQVKNSFRDAKQEVMQGTGIIAKELTDHLQEKGDVLLANTGNHINSAIDTTSWAGKHLAGHTAFGLLATAGTLLAQSNLNAAKKKRVRDAERYRNEEYHRLHRQDANGSLSPDQYSDLSDEIDTNTAKREKTKLRDYIAPSVMLAAGLGGGYLAHRQLTQNLPSTPPKVEPDAPFTNKK